jgi:hypothetical protein
MCTDDMESVPRLEATAMTNSDDDMRRLETSRNYCKSKRGEGVADRRIGVHRARKYQRFKWVLYDSKDGVIQEGIMVVQPEEKPGGL